MMRDLRRVTYSANMAQEKKRLLSFLRRVPHSAMIPWENFRFWRLFLHLFAECWREALGDDVTLGEDIARENF